MFTESDAEQFTEAYLEALVWSSDDESQEWRGARLSAALKERARIECRAFLYRVAVYIDAEPTAPGMAAAGHDFALTRNRHGAGFWDGDWPMYGELLTKVSHSFGEIDLYVSDAGEINA